MVTPPTEPTAPAPSPRFAGRSEFQQLVRDALARAAQEGWRELVLSDWDFADWPLGERAVAQSLQDWSKSGRKLVMLASRYDELIRRHARFVTWRRQWSHIIECWVCPKIEPTDFPSAVWSPNWTLWRLDFERSTGLHTADAVRRTEVRELLAEWQRKCMPGFPSSTLGL
jgi:hypothetical protein